MAAASILIDASERRLRFRLWASVKSVFARSLDVGDSWEHEVLFEGCPKAEKGQKYPVWLEGERACPPEEVGGMHGNAEFLKIIKDRDDEERVGMLEWAEGWFDRDEFDAATATKSMWKGLPEWRSGT